MDPSTLVTFNLVENVTVGTLVYTILATDNDAAQFGPLTYSLPVNGFDHFAIDAATGAITTTMEINRWQYAFFDLAVLVVDAGSKFVTAPILITVIGLNLHSPTFTQPGGYSGFIFENILNQTTLVVQTVATDIDQGRNGTVSYSMNSTAFFLNATTGAIYSSTMYDREVTSEYVIAVTASDAGVPPRVTTVIVVISIKDRNDNAPTFGPVTITAAPLVTFTPASGAGWASYRISTLADPSPTCGFPFEMCTSGFVITHVAATDPDYGVNAQLTYTLDTPSAFFAVDGVTGVVRTIAKLDREVQANYTVVVVCSDAGVPYELATRATILIYLVDINDNYPTPSTNLTTTVPLVENTAIGTVVCTALFTDKDAGLNGQVRYAFAEGSAGVSVFGINAITGAITITANISYNAARDYNVIVTAVDLGVPPLRSISNPLRSSSNQSFSIVVSDTNDFPPVVELPLTTIVMSSATPSNTNLFFFQSFDTDGASVNSDMSFAITTRTTGSSGQFVVVPPAAMGPATPSGTPRMVTLRTSFSGITAPVNVSLDITAVNPFAATPQHTVVTQRVVVVPFVGLEIIPDFTKVFFNWAMPQPCADPGMKARSECADFVPVQYEIWTRRAYNCTYTACSALTNGMCLCQIYGANVPGYNATSTNYTLTGMTSGTGNEYQLRTVAGVVLAYFDQRTPLFAIENLNLTTTVPNDPNPVSLQLSWTYPRNPNGMCVSQRVLWCESVLVDPAVCVSGGVNVTEIPAIPCGVSSQIIGPPNTAAIPAGRIFYFIVELTSVLADDTPVVTRSAPFLQTIILSSSSTGSATLPPGSAAGLAVGLVFAFALAILIVVVVLRSKRQKSLHKATADMFVPPPVARGTNNDSSTDDPVQWEATLGPLRQRIFSDIGGVSVSNSSSDDTPLKAVEPAGFWDYHSRERADLFWPTTSPSNESSTLQRTRSVGLKDSKQMFNGRYEMDAGVVWPKSLTNNTNPLFVDSPTSAMERSVHYRAFCGTARSAHTIDSAHLERYLDQMLQTGAIDTQFNEVHDVCAKHQPRLSAANHPANRNKNRYANVLPEDDSRVLLSNLGDPNSDYINANYIDGWRKPRAYIATQGPVPSTTPDFWRMMWEQDSSIIVMLTKEIELKKIKCHKYWPDDVSEPLRIGPLEVRFIEVLQPNDDYIIRSFILIELPTGTQRMIHQYAFLSWPDQGVPQDPSSLLNFLHVIRTQAAASRLSDASTGPLVIHCSAGIGRTGALALIDINIERLNAIANVDVFSTLCYMREQRPGSVQTEIQYQFIYEALTVYIQNASNAVPVRVAGPADLFDAPVFSRHTQLPGPEPEQQYPTTTGLSPDELQLIIDGAGPDDPSVSNNKLITILDSLYDESRRHS